MRNIIAPLLLTVHQHAHNIPNCRPCGGTHCCAYNPCAYRTAYACAQQRTHDRRANWATYARTHQGANVARADIYTDDVPYHAC